MLVVPIVRPDSPHRAQGAGDDRGVQRRHDGDRHGRGRSSASLFRPDRFLGRKTFAPESLLDTLRIPISTDTVLDRVQERDAASGRASGCVSTPGYDMRIGTRRSGARGHASDQGVDGHGAPRP